MRDVADVDAVVHGAEIDELVVVSGVWFGGEFGGVVIDLEDGAHE